MANGEALKKIADAKNVFPDYEIKVLVKPKRKASVRSLSKYLERSRSFWNLQRDVRSKASTKTAKINLYKFSHIKKWFMLCPEVKGKSGGLGRCFGQ
ncbi:MAG: hypothetical protein ACLRI7_10090 [Ruthenibacterium lactatiformans]